MPEYLYLVRVEAPGPEQADTAIREELRPGHEHYEEISSDDPHDPQLGYESYEGFHWSCEIERLLSTSITRRD